MFANPPADHPRECGANDRQEDRLHHRQGSSPRVRGKHTRKAPPAWAGRIIPASAGQTRLHPCGIYGRADHPRECGANWNKVSGWVSGIGSSPRVRGKPLSAADDYYTQRIIPASAGQTSPRRSTTAPPRIIPASAGQTDSGRYWRVVAADHPRECGANCPPQPATSMASGSSPRVRGKQQFDICHRNLLRIIPASAGQTCDRQARHRDHTDHPRECGANSVDFA